jgi:polyhydroxyalkanoate synthesis regulator phasin
MLDTFKNALLASLGLVAMTQEKLRGAVEDLVKRGELSAEQGRKLVEELLTKGQAEGRALSERISQEVAAVLEKMPFATRKDLRGLEDRILRLEASSSAPPPPPTNFASECPETVNPLPPTVMPGG